MSEDPNADPPSVLAVDDDPAWTKLIDSWLGDDYRVRTASDGREALEAYTPEVDLLFLDRQMPGPNGYEVLEELRECGATCPAVMLTGVDPEFDLVDVPFDEYLTKPVTEEEVAETAERLLTIAEYDDDLREFYGIVAKIATLEAEYDDGELRDEERYRWLLERRDRYRQRVDRMAAEVDPETAFREVGTGNVPDDPDPETDGAGDSGEARSGPTRPTSEGDCR